MSNDRSGHLAIDDSVLARNPSLGFETQGYPGIFYLGAGPPLVTNSVLTAPDSEASMAAIAALLALAWRARCRWGTWSG